jgi:hypothetical protein
MMLPTPYAISVDRHRGRIEEWHPWVSLPMKCRLEQKSELEQGSLSTQALEQWLGGRKPKKLARIDAWQRT